MFAVVSGSKLLSEKAQAHSKKLEARSFEPRSSSNQNHLIQDWDQHKPLNFRRFPPTTKISD